MKGLASILPGQSEPDATDDVCAMCPSLTYQQVSKSAAYRRSGWSVDPFTLDGWWSGPGLLGVVVMSRGGN